MKQRGQGRQWGFTLIEVMVTVAIIAILASIAVPSYNSYIVNANRRAAQSAMMDIGALQQQYMLSNREYAEKADLVSAGYSLPSDVSALYTWSVSKTTSGPPGFTLTLTPVSGGRQVSDGALTLNHQGVKTPAGKW